MKKLTSDEILQCPMYWPYGKDTDADTVEEYLLNLLSEVLMWQDEFDGKRPFGNSDWLYNDIGQSLAVAGLIESRSDGFGGIDFDYAEVGEVVQLAVAGIRDNLQRMRDLSD